MKCYIINSKDLFGFDIWSAEFYCNTNKEDMEKILKFRTKKRVEVEINKLKPILINMDGYLNIVCKVKKSMGMGINICGGISPTLNYKPRVNLLILYQVMRELNNYQKQKILEIQKQTNIIKQDCDILNKLIKTERFI